MLEAVSSAQEIKAKRTIAMLAWFCTFIPVPALARCDGVIWNWRRRSSWLAASSLIVSKISCPILVDVSMSKRSFSQNCTSWCNAHRNWTRNLQSQPVEFFQTGCLFCNSQDNLLESIASRFGFMYLSFKCIMLLSAATIPDRLLFSANICTDSVCAVDVKEVRSAPMWLLLLCVRSGDYHRNLQKKP